ncbi:serine/threonine-protein kinase ULK3 [Eurytemora carolleeae]|uniref:serine/threonine-protein kinase ULK3 n=1 Tax=Eurytemora carolleeae TaxID=1294199 RepID=UPI000C78473C|nr:serine/threonine-protein kinase ULK3 [Eurytemora carolleeae]|eukprot:XP_023346605.1 serine/threonine-protein kinase ULK3-like [Eurytemora affinis]
MAPEIVLTKSYSPKVDIWSVGVILFEALFGRAPFSSSTLEELIQKIKEDKDVSIPGDISLSPECRSFLSSCLQRNPEQRMGFKELKDDQFLKLELSIPQPHSEEKMVENERLGAVAESTGDLKQSINFYETAAEYAKTLYYYTEDESLRGKYKSSLRGYQTKLFNLTRDQLPSREVARQQVVNNSLPNYAELYHLAKITPGMEGGLEICIAARNYQLQGDIEQAVDRYTAGLGVLVPLLQKEPKGTRRDLLHEAVKCWLQQAEALKDTLQIQQDTLH